MSTTAEQAQIQQIAHLSADTPVEEILAVYERDHALIIDELADARTLEALQSELDGLLFPESTRDELRGRLGRRGEEHDFLGMKTRRAGALLAKVPAFHPLVMHPLILVLAQRILGKNSSIQLSASQAIAVLPGETPQPVHRDRWVWKDLPLPEDFEPCVVGMWAVSNFTAESGATHVIPGSFALPDPTCPDDIYEEKDAVLPDGRVLASLKTVQAEMTPGSVFLWGGNIYHGAGANRTDRPRVSLILSYIPAALRQEENQYLVAPPEVARELPEDLQKLIGYELGTEYSLGFVDGLKSPMTLLR